MKFQELVTLLKVDSSACCRFTLSSEAADAGIGNQVLEQKQNWCNIID